MQEGLPANPDYNGKTVDGMSQMQITVRDGKRFNTYMAYTKPVADRITIEVGCHVQEIIFDQTADLPRVTGVRSTQGGETRELFADEVILAAGAIDSPRLLLRSGIGPAAELAEVGIESRVDLPGVGKNLHDHYLAPAIFDSERPIDPAASSAP